MSTEPAAAQPSPARELADGLKVQPKAPPSKDIQRIGYGIVDWRTLNRAGLRYMNIQYYSTWLDEVLANKGEVDVLIKVDPMNLGCISAHIKGKWVSIPGPLELSGMDLQTWLEIGDQKAREVGEQARIDFKTFIAPAILDIDAAARRAERELGFLNLDWTAEMMREAERHLRTFIVYDRKPGAEEPALSGNSRMLGKVITRTSSGAIDGDLEAVSEELNPGSELTTPTQTTEQPTLPSGGDQPSPASPTQRKPSRRRS